MENEKINFDAPTKVEPKVPTKEQTQVQKYKDLQNETMAKVEDFVNELQQTGDIKLPQNYAVGNQLRLAWFQLVEVKDRNGKPALDVCTKASIANALLKMCVQGLSVYKKQCDFIVYGDQLTLSREYHGTIALAKRYGGVKDVTANVIYQDDIFKYTVNPLTGVKTITEHVQNIENLYGEIKGAYAVLTFEDKEPFVDIMTIKEIRISWNQGPMKGQSPAHKNFPGEMCKKTVISRACKLFISSSDDAGLLGDSETEEREPVKEEKKEKPVLDIPVTPHVDVTPKEKKEVKGTNPETAEPLF